MKKAALMISLALFIAGCAKASKEDCEKFAKHTVELSLKEQEGKLPKEMLEVARKEALKAVEGETADCEGKVAKSEIDCALAAQSMDELKKCGE